MLEKFKTYLAAYSDPVVAFEKTMLSDADTIDREFEQIWELYPRKIAKLPAKRAYKRLMKFERKELAEFVPKYIQNHKDAMLMDYLPNLSTVINQKRFNEPLPYKAKIRRVDFG